jgi:hypothetical protein
MFAGMYGETETVKFLLDQGANIEDVDEVWPSH